MRITIIDGQGGQLGAQLIKVIQEQFPDANLTVIGTNSVATATMLKAGAKNGATGENPVIVASKKSDVIIGPVGIVIADSLFGEITDKMAVAVGRSEAVKILIPMNRCENLVAGVMSANTAELISDAVAKLKSIEINKTT